ncbi:MAG: hypothetical protein M3Z85_12750, partial [Acidobacteriota bacterium]|nr:hypothetical protein [Acidobacteriota bacterium]
MARWLSSFFLGASLCLATDVRKSFFDQKVVPILTAQCAACHNEKVKTSGFSIASASSVIKGGNKLGPAVVAGDPAASPLIKVLKGDLTPRMPVGKVLPPQEIAVLEQWIRELKPEQVSGAKAADWLWPYKQPVRVEPPQVTRTEWVANPIDSFVLRKLEENKLAPAPAASKRTLAR